jgi:hypothetical protein
MPRILQYCQPETRPKNCSQKGCFEAAFLEIFLRSQLEEDEEALLGVFYKWEQSVEFEERG